jgi:hypothetical protein
MADPNDAQRTVATIRGIEAWLRSTGVAAPETFAVDLGEAYRSAQVLTAAVDLLLSGPDLSSAASNLARLQAWTYDDLVDHLKRLEGPLDDVLRQLHANMEGQA